MASSPRKIASARANGALSHGPTTSEGKQAVAFNSVKHGLTAETVVLSSESQEEYQAALDDYIDHFRPAVKPEMDLVQQLAAAQWRLARYAGVEFGLYEKKFLDLGDVIDEQYPTINDHTRLAIAFNHLSGANSSLALLNRYQARLHHEYQRILKSLQQMQAARLARDAKLQSKPNPISEQPAGLVAISAGAGFPDGSNDETLN